MTRLTRSGGGSIKSKEFFSSRATNVVLPQPVGPATIHVKGCFQRGSIAKTEQLLFKPSFLYVQWRRTIFVVDYFTISIEMGKRVSFLDGNTS